MKNLRELIIAVLLMWLVATFFLNNGVKTRIGQLEREKARLGQQLDSVTVLQRETAIHYMKAATELNLAKSKLQSQQAVTDSYRKKYEYIKSRPVPHLTDAQLDSVLSAIYPR